MKVVVADNFDRDAEPLQRGDHRLQRTGLRNRLVDSDSGGFHTRPCDGDGIVLFRNAARCRTDYSQRLASASTRIST